MASIRDTPLVRISRTGTATRARSERVLPDAGGASGDEDADRPASIHAALDHEHEEGGAEAFAAVDAVHVLLEHREGAEREEDAPTANASFTGRDRDGAAGAEGEGDAPEGAGERAADAPVRERVATIASDAEARATDEWTAASREARGRRRDIHEARASAIRLARVRRSD